MKNYLQSLQKKTKGNTRVVVTGYYQIFPDSPAKCAVEPALDASELTWLHGQIVALNDSIQKGISTFSFASFAPVDFSRHELCTNQPWIQSLRAKAPFHPTSDGQEAIGKAVSSAYK